MMESKETRPPRINEIKRLGEVTVTSKLKLAARHGAKGEVAPHQETKTGSEWSHKLGRMVKVYRDINRETNRYRERVVDPVRGDVLREVDEPLDQHTGHGSART